MAVYLDNAATTPIDERVLAAMLPYFKEYFGNPSSIHSHGRQARSAVEKARKKVADLLNTSPSEIFFTSCGTEADNTVLRGCLSKGDIQRIITSPLEHHAVLHTAEELAAKQGIELNFVAFDEKGVISCKHLENLLQDSSKKTLVSLMHGNNEIGNLLPIDQVAELCHAYSAIFHSDTVQTVGHYPIDLQATKVHSIVGSAHKFHGPKGIGFLYVNSNCQLCPLISGGAQERNMRGGTENIYGIVGLAEALEIAISEMYAHKQHVLKLKRKMIASLKKYFPSIVFNGMSDDINNSLHSIVSVSFAPHPANDMLLFNLDIHKISASGGSACSSGSDIGSHVLNALKIDSQRAAVRFSFSRFNTEEEVDYTVAQLCKIYEKNSPVAG